MWIKCKNIGSRLNKDNDSRAKNSTHCCKCNYPIRLEEMMLITHNNKMIYQYRTNKRNKQKRMPTPQLSPQPDKQTKSIDETIEDLPPPEDPIESMKLDDEPTSSSTPTYTQITSQSTSKDTIPTKL